MTNVIEIYEKEQIQKLTLKKRIPAFRSGDTVKVSIKIVEGKRSRFQIFEGICIARKNNGINSNFTIRKISHGEGVEKVFPLLSPLIDKIEITKKGNVRRAKLYYLRDRKGKSARIVESTRDEEADQYELIETTETDELSKNSPENSTEDVTETVSEDNQSQDKKPLATDENDKEVVSPENNPIEEKPDSSSVEAENSANETKS